MNIIELLYRVKNDKTTAFRRKSWKKGCYIVLKEAKHEASPTYRDMSDYTSNEIKEEPLYWKNKIILPYFEYHNSKYIRVGYRLSAEDCYAEDWEEYKHES